MATDPICGMYVDERAAELKLVRQNRTYYFCSTHCLYEFSEPQKELDRLRLTLAISWPLSLAIVLLTYLDHVSDWPWIAFGLATVVQFYPGLEFYRSSYAALRSRNWNMDLLIVVGTTTAYLYSFAVLVAPSRLPSAYYFDSSSLIVTLILTGNYLEHLTRERARGTLRALGELLPATVRVVRGGEELVTPLSDVRVHDRYRARPGERFATDARVLAGHSTVSEAALTGESVPVAKGPGDLVIAGSVNAEGVLDLEATRVGEDTALSQIAQLVAEAETSRVPLQTLADRIATIFVPLVLLLGIGAAVGWYLIGVGFTVALLVLISVVITACPCAFGIATPAALIVGTGRAAEEGILFKGRDSLERASQVDLVLTDKTGTLTQGKPALTDLVTAPGILEVELLAIAAGVEAGSEHPLARAVVERASSARVPPRTVERIRAEPGVGIRGWMGDEEVAVVRGSDARGLGSDSGDLPSAVERIVSEGRACSLVVRGSRVVGVLGFDDPPAPNLREAVQTLAEDGIETILVTGDHPAAAHRLAAIGGIRTVHAGLTPAAKLELLRTVQRSGRHVAYVGDGINDAPALAGADLGIAIGAGTDVAREAAGVILMRSDFGSVALSLRIGRRTVRKVRGNLSWAIGYNAVLLPIAMGALVPWLGLRVYSLLPITGAIAMAASSTLVVLNSLSLRWIRLGRV